MAKTPIISTALELLEKRCVFDTADIEPVADSFVWEKNPTVNYGAFDDLYVSNPGAGLHAYSLLRFNPRDSMPAGSTVNSASLYLSPWYVAQTGDHNIRIRPLLSSWSELGVTWDNMPQASNTLDDFDVDPSDVYKTIKIVLEQPAIDMIQKWLDQPTTNFGFRLNPVPDHHDAIFRSREWQEDPSERPRLEISYTRPNQNPRVGSLNASPDPVTTQQTLSLTANNVSDPDGTVSIVEFYRESNGQSGLQPGSDESLGADSDPTGGWRLSKTVPSEWAGSQTFYARALDDDGAWSSAAQDSVSVVSAPQLGDLDFTVLDQLGLPTSNVTLIRYAADWSTHIDQRITGPDGRAFWDDIAAGTYNLEAYAGLQYWGAIAVTVTSGQTTTANLQRKFPHLVDIRAFNEDGFDVTGHMVAANAELTIKVRARHGFGSTVFAAPALWLKLDGSAPAKFEKPMQDITAGELQSYDFKFTPRAAGSLARYPEIYTMIGGRPVLTDSWSSKHLVTVTTAEQALTTTVHDQFGGLTPGVDVYLYEVSAGQWRPVGHRKTQTDGSLTWQHLRAASYALEYDYGPEHWGSTSTTAPATAPWNVDFTRQMPAIWSSRVFNAATGAELTGRHDVQLGTTLRIQILIKDNHPALLSAKSKTWFYQPAVTSGPHESPYTLIQDWGRLVTFTYKPTTRGLLQTYHEIYARLGDRDVLTDVWGKQDLCTII